MENQQNQPAVPTHIFEKLMLSKTILWGVDIYISKTVLINWPESYHNTIQLSVMIHIIFKSTLMINYSSSLSIGKFLVCWKCKRSQPILKPTHNFFFPIRICIVWERGPPSAWAEIIKVFKFIKSVLEWKLHHASDVGCPFRGGTVSRSLGYQYFKQHVKCHTNIDI